MPDAAKHILSGIQYRYLYRQDGDIVSNPAGLKPKQARRVYTNLDIEDFDPDRDPVLFDNEKTRWFFSIKGTSVQLKSCPACRETYDPEHFHVCMY